MLTLTSLLCLIALSATCSRRLAKARLGFPPDFLGPQGFEFLSRFGRLGHPRLRAIGFRVLDAEQGICQGLSERARAQAAKPGAFE